LWEEEGCGVGVVLNVSSLRCLLNLESGDGEQVSGSWQVSSIWVAGKFMGLHGLHLRREDRYKRGLRAEPWVQAGLVVRRMRGQERTMGWRRSKNEKWLRGGRGREFKVEGGQQCRTLLAGQGMGNKNGVPIFAPLGQWEGGLRA
jgi:hypothetical protein